MIAPLPENNVKHVYPNSIDEVYLTQWMKEQTWPFEDAVMLAFGVHPSCSWSNLPRVLREVADSLKTKITHEQVNATGGKTVVVNPVRLVEETYQFLNFQHDRVKAAYRNATGKPLEYRHNSPVALFYEKWCKRDVWTLSEAVCLVCGIDPDTIPQNNPKKLIKDEYSTRAENKLFPINIDAYNDLHKTASTSIQADKLKVTFSSTYNVVPLDFLAWADSKRYTYNPLLRGLVEVNNNTNFTPKPDRYVSPYVELMLKAGEHFNITAEKFPKSEELIEWFDAQILSIPGEVKGKTGNKVKLMATLVRPPTAQTGGNKKTKPKG